MGRLLGTIDQARSVGGTHHLTFWAIRSVYCGQYGKSDGYIDVGGVRDIISGLKSNRAELQSAEFANSKWDPRPIPQNRPKGKGRYGDRISRWREEDYRPTT